MEVKEPPVNDPRMVAHTQERAVHDTNGWIAFVNFFGWRAPKAKLCTVAANMLKATKDVLREDDPFETAAAIPERIIKAREP